MRPLKKIMVVATAFVLAGALVGCGSEEKVELSAAEEQEVAERLAPVGEVAKEGESQVAAATEAPAEAAGPRSGEEVYNTKCMACHATGAAGAPKAGVAADWTARLEQGMDTLYAHAINGIRGMPPKGLCSDCSAEELNAAVDHMVDGL
mgnify:CR=1 FL=1